MDTARFDTILRKYLKNLAPQQELTSDARLKDLGLNSMRAIDLLFDLEDEFGVELPDDAMTDDTFATRDALLDRVREAQDTTAGAR
ncbi:phosphopantetheine-binding protein [Amycolatopsis sp. NPDC003731]